MSQLAQREGHTTTLSQLAQREGHTTGVTSPVRLQNPLRIQHNPEMTVGYVQIQKMWKGYVHAIFELCSKQFWSLFQVVNQEKGTCADAVLKWTKHLLQAQPQVLCSKIYQIC